MNTFPIIEKLGGRKAVAARLHRRVDGKKRALTADTVRMWCSRSSIPGYALKQLLTLAEREKIAVCVDDLRPVRKPRRKTTKEAA